MQTRLFLDYAEKNAFINNNRMDVAHIDDGQINIDWINDLFNQDGAYVKQGDEWMGFISEYPVMVRKNKNHITFHSLHDIYVGTLCSTIQKRLQDESDNKHLAVIHLFSEYIHVSFFTLNENPEKSHEIFDRYTELKKKYPHAFLLFRCGDFYETYSDDASEAARILGITLTTSMEYSEENGRSLRMGGFPHHALDTYLPKLIRAGKMVHICDQTELTNR